jgi:exonuclease VII large subunit
MEKKSYSLVELNTFIKRILALNFENEIWVKAEILSLNVKRGHYYLTLIQKDHSSDEITPYGQQISSKSKKPTLTLTVIL